MVDHYKVWVHIEGLNAEGDTIEGDEYHDPLQAGRVKTLAEAEKLRDWILACASYPGSVRANQERFNQALKIVEAFQQDLRNMIVGDQ